MTQGQRLYAEKPYLRLQVPHSLDEPPTSHVPLATSSPRSCASMSGHRGPTRWHVDRTSLELIFVVSIPNQARGTDRTAYGDVSLMSSPASRSICRQYTGPILVNIPAHHQVQLRSILFFCGFQHQPKHNALGRHKTGIIDRLLYNPPISALVSVPDHVWLYGWLPTLADTIYGNGPDQHH